MKTSKRKEGSTYGNAWMFRTLISWLGHIDIRVFYCFMYVCVIPITMIVSPGARLTYHYFKDKLGYNPFKALWSTYRNHCIFGQTVIDKFAMYSGHKFKIQYYDEELLNDIALDPNSQLLLSAHIGCSEIVGYSFHLDKPCNVLVYGGEKQSLMTYRKVSFGNMNIKMIPVGTETTHSDEILQALDNGETISAFADRFMNNGKVVVSTLHGEKVNLAKGPFSLAVTRGLNVIMISGLKEKNDLYSAYITPLPYDKSLPKKEQRQQLADAYTAEIERLLEKYPLQWFNYSDLWVNSKDCKH